MSDIRFIQVESCLTCKSGTQVTEYLPRFYCSELHKYLTFPEQGIHSACPLPKWPSVTMEELTKQTAGMIIQLKAGGTAADPLSIETLAFPWILEIIKSIGVEIKGGNDEEK